jgi:hypothetical protein
LLSQVELPEDAVLFAVRQQVGEAGVGRILPVHPGRDARRQIAAPVVEGVDRQAELAQVAPALDPVGRLAHLLDRRQQQANQGGNDRQHDQKFSECETSSMTHDPLRRLECP